MIRSAGFMLLSTLLRIGTAAGLFVLLAREWGVASFGSFMYAYTISQIATVAIAPARTDHSPRTWPNSRNSG